MLWDLSLVIMSFLIVRDTHTLKYCPATGITDDDDDVMNLWENIGTYRVDIVVMFLTHSGAAWLECQ